MKLKAVTACCMNKGFARVLEEKNNGRAELYTVYRNNTPVCLPYSHNTSDINLCFFSPQTKQVCRTIWVLYNSI